MCNKNLLHQTKNISESQREGINIGYVIQTGVAQIDSDVHPDPNWRVPGDWCLASCRHVATEELNCRPPLSLCNPWLFFHFRRAKASTPQLWTVEAIIISTNRNRHNWGCPFQILVSENDIRFLFHENDIDAAVRVKANIIIVFEFINVWMFCDENFPDARMLAWFKAIFSVLLLGKRVHLHKEQIQFAVYVRKRRPFTYVFANTSWSM